MIVDTPFDQLKPDEQNRLLRKVGDQLRPMLGEIGEVLVEKRSDDKKPGFIGMLFRHSADRSILFAEYIDQDTRLAHIATSPRPKAEHIFGPSAYLNSVLKAGSQRGEVKSDVDLVLNDLDLSVKEVFRGFYKEEVDSAEFRIKVQAMALCKPTDSPVESLLYFAHKSGEERYFKFSAAESLAALIEQLVRNALGLAVISDQELRSIAGSLSRKLPQTFDSYVLPQTLAAIYAYVREVVHVSLEEAPRFPKLTGLVDGNTPQLSAIHDAHSIAVNRAVGGSLKGASVYSLTVTTSGESATEFSAIAKFSKVSEARKEADGLRQMQRYYARIGRMLPPSLLVYLCRLDNGSPALVEKDWLETPCISVTPDLEGSVLSEKVAAHWASPTHRTDRFSSYLAQARDFLDHIQAQSYDVLPGTSKPEAKSEEPKESLLRFADNMSREPARYGVLANALPFPENDQLRMEWRGHSVTVVNPARWITTMLESPTAVRWRSQSSREPRIVLTHGDFHAGNLFYSVKGDHLTVLDYDRVGGGTPEQDAARLDASFATVVFSLSDFSREDNWLAYAPDSLAILANQHPARIRTLDESAFARDLFETLTVIRPSKFCAFHAASVVEALLIDLKTSCTHKLADAFALKPVKEMEAMRGRNAAVWLYLSLALTHLVELGDGNPATWNPWESALPKETT